MVYLSKLQSFPLVRLNLWHSLFCREHSFPMCYKQGTWDFNKAHHVLILIMIIIALFVGNREEKEILLKFPCEVTVYVGSSCRNILCLFEETIHVGSSHSNPCRPSKQLHMMYYHTGILAAPWASLLSLFSKITTKTCSKDIEDILSLHNIYKNFWNNRCSFEKNMR